MNGEDTAGFAPTEFHSYTGKGVKECLIHKKNPGAFREGSHRGQP